MAGKRKNYLIVQLVGASGHGLYSGIGAMGNGRPVLVLGSRGKAVSHVKRLEWEARKILSPFHVSSPESWSSLGLAGLIERLQELGLRDLPDPATRGREAARQWRRWWDDHGGELSAEQIEAVWKLLDQVELYQVVEIPVKE